MRSDFSPLYPYNLVNNVARSLEFPVPFAESTLEAQHAIVNINISATLRVTQIILKNMIQQYVYDNSTPN